MHPTDNELHLPSSRLVWNENGLTRLTKGGENMANFAAGQIRNLELHRPWDPVALSLVVVFALLAAAAYQFIPAEVWKWSLTCVLGGLSLLLILGSKKNRIRVFLDGGEEAEFEYIEPKEEVEAFLFSVRGRLKESGVRP